MALNITRPTPADQPSANNEQTVGTEVATWPQNPLKLACISRFHPLKTQRKKAKEGFIFPL
ncbi:MAG: hypothetical protein LBV74_05375 [Tannerella sp.]|jgi:myo-inositol catabolism protein IolC|nr:hypothetical protein [Tannerella sp.]